MQNLTKWSVSLVGFVLSIKMKTFCFFQEFSLIKSASTENKAKLISENISLFDVGRAIVSPSFPFPTNPSKLDEVYINYLIYHCVSIFARKFHKKTKLHSINAICLDFVMI